MSMHSLQALSEQSQVSDLDPACAGLRCSNTGCLSVQHATAGHIAFGKPPVNME